MSHEEGILLLNTVLEDLPMIIMWALPLALALCCFIRKRNTIFIVIAGIAVFRIAFYFWALSGLWRSHFVATAFNRSMDVFVLITVILLVRALSKIDGNSSK